MKEEDYPTVWGANTPRYWAKAWTEYDAVKALAAHYEFNEFGSDQFPDVPEDGVRMAVMEAKGNIWPVQSINRVGLDAEEIVNVQKYVVPRKEFTELVRAMDGLEVLAENCLVEAEEVDE